MLPASRSSNTTMRGPFLGRSDPAAAAAAAAADRVSLNLRASASCFETSTTAASQSATMKQSRSAGYVESIGTSTPPAMNVAISATTISAPESTRHPTACSGPLPSSRARCLAVCRQRRSSTP